jgi:hypothetical protein
MSIRHFGIQGGRPTPSWGHSGNRPSASHGTHSLPRVSIISAPLERGKVSPIVQALIDCLAVTFGIFFLCATACSVPVALFMLLV